MTEQHQTATPPKSNSLLAITLRKFFNCLGFAVGVFILYGVVAEVTNIPWAPLDKWMNFLSSLFTLVGTILTAGTVYVWSRQPHPPERFSLYISAPLVIAGAITGIGFLFWNQQLPIPVVNGFAMLAMAGAFFRIQPHTVE